MKTLLTALITGMLSLLVGAAVATGAAYMHTPSTENPIADSGCVIRFDEKTSTGNTRPRVHANSTHYCVGVASVTAAYPSGDLVIEMQTVGPIVSIAVSPDETLASRDIACGARGGMGTIIVQCYRNGQRVKAYSSTMYGSTSNLWIGWESWSQ